MGEIRDEIAAWVEDVMADCVNADTSLREQAAIAEAVHDIEIALRMAGRRGWTDGATNNQGNNREELWVRAGIAGLKGGGDGGSL